MVMFKPISDILHLSVLLSHFNDVFLHLLCSKSACNFFFIHIYLTSHSGDFVGAAVTDRFISHFKTHHDGSTCQ